ncbi:MAG: membrane dipeptidase [Oscillospiraceae bacterium]|jgi:membrane dipeptidase|nr:membrane dipeptidase [Oscillospiraceae bacterium]
MKYFDLHCDTITLLAGEEKKKLAQSGAAVSLEKGAYLEKWVQVFAVWIPDTKRGQSAVDYYKRLRDVFFAELAENSDKISLFAPSSGKGIDGRATAVLSIEGGAALGGKLENLETAAADGVKLITLTWNGENELGYGSVDGGGGLKPFGREAVRKMNEYGVIVDVSHLSDEGFRDVERLSAAPFVASHSNARSVCGHPRNLTDGQIKAIIERGGLIGLNFYRDFVRGENPAEAGLEDLERHIYHILNLGGQDALCMGSDFDGCVTVAGLKDLRDTAGFYDYMLNRGYDKALLEKIFFLNAYSFFAKFYAL